MILRNFPGFSTQLVHINYCVLQKNGNVFQTLLYAKETSTHNIMYKFQSDMFDNMSIIVLTQIHIMFFHFFGIGSVSSYFL